MKLACMPDNHPRTLLRLLLLLLLLAILLCACGGGGPEPPPRDTGYSQTHNWERITIAGYEESGMLLPHVVARPAADGSVHIAYYDAVELPDDAGEEESDEPAAHYFQIKHLIWNPNTNTASTRIVANKPTPGDLYGFDNCEQFDMALDGNTPIMIYPTYEVHMDLEDEPDLYYNEADIMVNFWENASWNEYTGAVGYIYPDRNPVYSDGHIKDNMSMAVDADGGIHFCYQYYYENMDEANINCPDLFYTFQPRENLPTTLGWAVADYASVEEQVDGNTFSTYGDHNSVGYHCKLILDPDGLPVIVYGQQDTMGANPVFALKVAYRNAEGQWRIETVDGLPTGWKVGGISAAFYPPDPEAVIDPEDPEAPEPERPLAIAYALRSPDPEPDNAHRLMFAVKREGRWSTEIVDETTWCGKYCSLAFTPDRYPSIAYFDEESHSGYPHSYLKYAEFNGVLWVKESAEEHGIVGQSNTLWFDGQGRPNICTYSEEDNEILVIRQIN